jgi:hypothetical protein
MISKIVFELKFVKFFSKDQCLLVETKGHVSHVGQILIQMKSDFGYEGKNIWVETYGFARATKQSNKEFDRFAKWLRKNVESYGYTIHYQSLEEATGLCPHRHLK